MRQNKAPERAKEDSPGPAMRKQAPPWVIQFKNKSSPERTKQIFRRKRKWRLIVQVPQKMKDQDLVKLFESVVQDVERLKDLRRKDWKKAAQEVGLHRGLPCNYDDFCNEFFECGKLVARSLYEMAASKLSENPRLRGRVKVETFLKPIEVEFAQQGIMKRAKIDKALMNTVLAEAERRAASTLEDRIYFFPVFTIDVN